MDLKRIKDSIHFWYFQYLLVTCCYGLLPWEQCVINSIIFIVVAMVVYTAYVFIPIHIRLAFEFLSQMFGSQPESMASLIN
ncbi:serine palmitoyltransferase small subunit B-like [Anolis carolinensis]|uniref:serine palmitoyltransferase small subunit B-like n=1 Tax=Anolis carolinensis TaxID=28377 RepID=UPI0002038C48|nr:PREDICTED: serine palmitoyltransferase small subunit B-like [Anolis carolinensis]XP_016854409.1 PREDICTED: serine palmitoyltransferase small subunit B-like [Anolis carolinensis]|eukprot:XP_016847515.1 PREDICTED: serine palmitoyltransferase small subunit B-like [Anolis carolinensis]